MKSFVKTFMVFINTGPTRVSQSCDKSVQDFQDILVRGLHGLYSKCLGLGLGPCSISRSDVGRSTIRTVRRIPRRNDWNKTTRFIFRWRWCRRWRASRTVRRRRQSRRCCWRRYQNCRSYDSSPCRLSSLSFQKNFQTNQNNLRKWKILRKMFLLHLRCSVSSFHCPNFADTLGLHVKAYLQTEEFRLKFCREIVTLRRFWLCLFPRQDFKWNSSLLILFTMNHSLWLFTSQEAVLYCTSLNLY